MHSACMAGACECEKNVVHCTITIATFNVHTVLLYLQNGFYYMFVCDSNSILKHIYNVNCNHRKNVNYSKHITKKRPLCETEPHFSMYVYTILQSRCAINETCICHCNFINRYIKLMYSSKIEFMVKTIVVKNDVVVVDSNEYSCN